jgi:hypothetical protein
MKPEEVVPAEKMTDAESAARLVEWLLALRWAADGSPKPRAPHASALPELWRGFWCEGWFN